MAGEASSGAFIRVPSFSCWQNSSLICTPGYGEAPGNRNGGCVGGKQVIATLPSFPNCSALATMVGAHPAAPGGAWARPSPAPGQCGTALPERLTVGTGAFQPYQQQQGSWKPGASGSLGLPLPAHSKPCSSASGAAPAFVRSPAQLPLDGNSRSSPSLERPKGAARATSPPSHCIY